MSIDNSTVLSELTNYSIEYGTGTDPYSWDTRGIELARDCSQGDCQITNDTLALWNTGLLGSGSYTLRITAFGGTNSNVLYRCVGIRHCTIRVKKDGTGDFLSIQAAVDSAQAGDTILVYAGDYGERVVMKEAVHLIGVEDSVRIIGGNAISLKIENHVLPCSIRNIDIRNDGYYNLGTGILISNSSPTITDCLIQNQGSDISSQPCGIRITGNSKPTFFNCTIQNNRATYGAGLRMAAGSGESPAPSFYNCSFVGNEATGTGYGGAVYMNYATPLDTTHAQPYFNGCVFRDNAATTNGSALYLGYCHAPFFTHCTFLNNRPATASGSPIYGISSGGQFANCTFKGNAGESYAAVLDLYNGTARVKVNGCIFAYNDIESIRRGGDYYDVNYSCFYDNEPVDSAWLGVGTGNFQANPAFCDQRNNDLHLYSFSPCAPTVSGFDLIGAYGVDCTPHLDSLLHCGNPHISAWPPNSGPDNPTLYVCPDGTWDNLKVHIDLADSDMTRDIAAEELELISSVTPCVKFFCNDSMHADSAATSGNGWKTTITYSIISGCGADSLCVELDGSVIGKLGVAFKSPDYTGPGGFVDGLVGLADLVPFGSAYQKCKGQPGYNECFNFAHLPGDTCVNLTDYTYWAGHYQHSAPCYETAAQRASKAVSGVVLELPAQLEIIDKERYLNVDVNLRNAQQLVSICLALDGEKVGLEYLSWKENAAQEGTIMAAPINRDGSNVMFICFVAEDGIQADSMCLGTVRYRMKSEDASLANNRAPFEEMALLAFGDAMTSDGTIKGIGSAGIEIAGETVKYFDYLKNGYPNPFNPITTVEYSISRDSHVNLSIYNANGQLVRALVNGKQKKNVYSISWDGKDNGGRAVASGIYFCMLKSDFFERSQKLILLR
ncbi:MAG: T9SS type A sorting domain-containing protein [Candidatus Krumholzibacteria bacterium]|nr:T9SS type A sorting domain-containing protein [Candidatus Krumholzibacteria bacterium]